MQITSYHNHTCWSDGSGTLDAMLAGARRAGVDEFGISDHYVLAPAGKHIAWSMPLEQLDQYVHEVLAARADAGLVLRLGIEADYFPETIGELADRLQPYPFDYRIGSVHFVDGFSVDDDAALWEALGEDERNAVWRGYWQRVAALAASGVFDIVGHLDLPKKFGYRPTIDLTAEIDAALAAIAAAGMAIELNTAGWNKPVREAYPALSLLQQARSRHIPLLITADAHHPADCAAHFPAARHLAASAGYTEFVRYEQRMQFPAG